MPAHIYAVECKQCKHSQVMAFNTKKMGRVFRASLSSWQLSFFCKCLMYIKGRAAPNKEAMMISKTAMIL